MKGWISWCGLVLLFFGSKQGRAQDLQSTRIWSLGGAGLAMSGQASVFDSPASLAWLSPFQVEATWWTPLDFFDFQRQGIGLGWGTAKGGVGLSLARKGLENTYHQMQVSLGLARRFGPRWGVGVKGIMQPIWVQHYPNSVHYAWEWSQIWRISKNFQAALAFGPVSLSAEQQLKYWPIQTSLSYAWSNHLQAHFMLRHEGVNWGWALGAELLMGHKVKGRMAWANQPTRPLFGFSYVSRNWVYEGGWGYYPYLGWVCQWGLQYRRVFEE
jgi:hypothetical protein